MRILIVSDNHQDQEILRKVLMMNQKIDLFLHAGDSELSEAELSPFISVKGNNDYLIFQDYRIIVAKWARIYLTHGHNELRFGQLINQAKKVKCNVIIHGHTHKSNHYQQDGILIICPGALNYPRGGQPRRYAILTIKDEVGQFELEYKDILDW